ncbi:hypothetical protein ACFFQW_23610 [Umezawaea endophytica]|uniref:Uncharacterized protein n=1 Tax=Umezawaea endophytica TaxID=1654476 RepID=A0A9X2VQB4_9PSEU|nr:hypothetical protein [Umezawaea endophytica]MCS7480746.1 hypothetical protein [Umezawaea endophytica]
MAKPLQRFNPWPIVLYHNKANRAEGEDKATRPELLLMYGLPTLIGAVFVVFRVRLGGVPQLLAATSLLVGVMISVFVFLANLRVKVHEVAEFKERRSLRKLIASSAVGALYVSSVSMTLSLCLALIASVPALGNPGFISFISSAIAAWLLVHLVVSLASVLRRLFGIYVTMFRSDFSAELDP